MMGDGYSGGSVMMLATRILFVSREGTFYFLDDLGRGSCGGDSFA